MSIEQYQPFACPYCFSENILQIDITGGSTQEFVVDCETCCSPIQIILKLSGDQILTLDVKKEND